MAISVSGNAAARDDVRSQARAVRAQKELARLEELRLIDRAVRENTPQATIAELLGTSQPTVSRIAKQIERDPSILQPGPREAINRRAVGQIDSAAMMHVLLSCTYTAGRHDPTDGDGYIRGDWRQIENALVAGLITDEEYEQIARQARVAKPTRAAG